MARMLARNEDKIPNIRGRFTLLVICLVASTGPLVGSTPPPRSKSVSPGWAPGAEDEAMEGRFAVSASLRSGGSGKTFDTAMKREVAQGSDGQHPEDGPSSSGGERAWVSPQAEYKMSCYRDGDPHQQDIIEDGHSGAGGGHWPGAADLGHGQSPRDPRYRREVTHRSRRVEMLLSERDARVGSRRTKRGATAYEHLLWPGGIIPYVIDPDFSNSTRDLLLKSMRHWMEHTCLRFVPRTDHNDYVSFLFGRGCCSRVGRQGGAQNVSLGLGCWTFGTVLHEMGHVIGFWHEQSRTDRDDHVTVLEDNIIKSEGYNFHKHSDKTINSMGQPYDFDSVMHYGPRDFGSGGAKTIVPKGERVIGQRRALSVGDILQTKLLYRCHDKGKCGGTLFGARGFIASPAYPQPMPPNVTCDWSIAAPAGSALKLEFRDIDLPYADDGKCDDAYVELREGLGELSPLIGRFCGDVKPDSVFTEAGRLWLRFKSGLKRHRTASGFAVRYQSVSIHRYLTKSRGVIRSMNYPLSFPPDTASIWQITVSYGFIIILRLNELLIPHVKRTGCPGDFLTLIDGYDSQSKLITKLCRSQKGVGAATSGTALRIELHSTKRHKKHEGKVTRFMAKYTARDQNECRVNNGGCAQACKNTFGNYVCGCREGFRVAPDYHNCTDVNECLEDNGGCSHTCLNAYGSYMCECPVGYRISPEDHTQCIDIDECEEPGLDICQQFCHNTIGAFACSCEPQYILATDGLRCEAIPDCGGYIHDVEGSMTRPQIPVNNTNSVDCIWFINVPDTFRILVRLSLFDWPVNNSCSDYFEIRGEEGVSSEYPRICGERDLYKSYNTTSSRVWVRYHSDWPHDEGAFIIDYFSTEHLSSGPIMDQGEMCGGVLNESGVMQTPGFPDHQYPSKLECVWRVTNASVIRLHFEKFDLEPESTCQYDYLEIIDHGADVGSDIDDGTHIGRFCGSEPPPTEIKIQSGQLSLVFRSDATVQAGGFRAVYEIQ